MMRLSLAVMIILHLSTPTTSMAQTAIGSGGDVLHSYVREISLKVNEVLDHIAANPETSQTLCRSSASEDRIEFCRLFATAKSAQFKTLVRTLTRDESPSSDAKLVITEDDLFRRKPNGELVPVAAITEIGPDGEILFNYQKVAGLSPFNLFSLVLHELGHKIEFAHRSNNEERNYIEDYGPVGPFKEGHIFLDYLGIELAEYALSNGLIATSFRYTDKYFCEKFMLVGGQETPIGAEYLHSPRRFKGTGSAAERLKRYEFGIGPGRGVTSLIPEGNNCLSFTISTDEADNCSEYSEDRSTLVEMWRHFPETNGTVPEPQLLQTEFFDGVNPACEEDEISFQLTQATSNTSVKFKCTYVGGEGNPSGFETKDPLSFASSACRNVRP